jgi:hypothetical protein
MNTIDKVKQRAREYLISLQQQIGSGFIEVDDRTKGRFLERVMKPTLWCGLRRSQVYRDDTSEFICHLLDECSHTIWDVRNHTSWHPSYGRQWETYKAQLDGMAIEPMLMSKIRSLQELLSRARVSLAYSDHPQAGRLREMIRHELDGSINSSGD